MKILYITFENLSPHKGSVVHVRETVNGLQKLGHHVGLIARSEKKFEEYDHFYNLHPGKLKRQPYIISSVVLFFYLLKLLPDYGIVYVWEFYLLIITLFPRLLFRRKLVFEINGIAHEEQRLKAIPYSVGFLPPPFKRLKRWRPSGSDRIVSVTPQIASYLIHKFNCRPDKIEIVVKGVNRKRFYPIHDKTVL